MEKVRQNGKISWQLKEQIANAVNACCDGLNVTVEAVSLEHPTAEEHGDYSSNIALQLAKQLRDSPRKVAEKIVAVLEQTRSASASNDIIEKVEIAGAGFINFTLKQSKLIAEIGEIKKLTEKYGFGSSRQDEKIMIEFAHPNTHKQFHIGHLRNIVLGESIIRILESAGAKVYRTNYQGDVGMHVAKAVYGVLKLKDGYEQARELDTRGRVEFLGKAYVFGNKEFEENEEAKKEIVALNKKIYHKDLEIVKIWKETRQWSLDYFQLIYGRVYSKFDRLYFESEVAERGKQLVLQNVGKVFEESDGAIIFPGEKFGLHNRVFINSEGNPTYEGKDMGLGELQFKEYNPDVLIHNLGPEQWGYTQVMFEALAQLFPETRGREMHLTYGWVKLKEGKMSSRTGNVVLGEWLLDEVKSRLTEKYPDRVSDPEPIAVAAVKFSLLKVSSNQEISFSIDESVSLEGDSGPYIQYTYARAKSVLRKATNQKQDHSTALGITNEEMAILRWIYRFPEVATQAAKTYSPNLIASYLFELAKRFNNFYNNVQILGKDNEGFRLNLVEATSIVLKNGLNLLGIEALERM